MDKENRKKQMGKENERCYHVTGGHGAGQGAERAIKGHHNTVTLHKADPGSALEGRRRGPALDLRRC